MTSTYYIFKINFDTDYNVFDFVKDNAIYSDCFENCVDTASLLSNTDTENIYMIMRECSDGTLEYSCEFQNNVMSY